MKEFEKWIDKEDSYTRAHGRGMATVGWVAALEWVKKEAISLDERGDISREIINRELGISRTKVVNLRSGSYDVYIGRGSKFGNPYCIGPYGSRKDVIALHKKAFYNNSALQEAVWVELTGKTLGCFCAPQACHGDTYVEYIQNRMEKNNDTTQDRYSLAL